MEEQNEKQQEMIYKFSVFEQQMRQIQEQLQLIEQGMNDLVSLKEGIESIKGKKNNEIFAHVGKGIFVKAKLLSEDLIVDIGKKNFVKKNINETKVMIDKQVKRLEEIHDNLNSSVEEINEEMVKLIGEVEKEKN